MNPLPSINEFEPHKKRFLLKIQIGKEDNDCWIWTAVKNAGGYGQFRFNGKNYNAHRLAYLVFHQEQPGDFLVCHTCDNPPCCNPRHLKLGTPKNNTDDMVSKGRHSHGENHNLRTRKLNRHQVWGVRALRSSGVIFKDIAQVYGISRYNAQDACSGKTYKWVK